MYGTCCLFGAVRKDFDAGNIHYKGHWKGWALKIETFLGPEMAASEASVIWAQKSRDFMYMSFCILNAVFCILKKICKWLCKFGGTFTKIKNQARRFFRPISSKAQHYTARETVPLKVDFSCSPPPPGPRTYYTIKSGISRNCLCPKIDGRKASKVPKSPPLKLSEYINLVY
jgi:hypothetical protein